MCSLHCKTTVGRKVAAGFPMTSHNTNCAKATFLQWGLM
jgi:hypothetical protein